MKKRILSIILAVLMVISILPLTVFAKEQFELKFTVPTNGYIACSVNGEPYKVITAENMTVSVAFGQSVSIRAISKYGYKLKSMNIKDKDFEMPEENVSVSAEFEENTSPVTLSDNTKMLLKKYAELIGDSQEKAVESVSLWFADPANESGIIVINDLMSDKYSVVADKSADSYRYARTLSYVTMLGLTASFDNVFMAIPDGNGEIVDTLRCVLDKFTPLKNSWLELIDAMEAFFNGVSNENNAFLLAEAINIISVSRAELCDECIMVDDGVSVSCFGLTKANLTNTNISGTFLQGNTAICERIAQLFCSITGRDEDNIKKYADDHAAYLKSHSVREYLEECFPETGTSKILLTQEEVKKLSQDEYKNHLEKIAIEALINGFSAIVEGMHTTKVEDIKDALRCLMNNSFSLSYYFLDLLDACQTEDYASIDSLINDIDSATLNLLSVTYTGSLTGYKKVFVDESIESGSINADILLAKSGEQITLIVKPATGYELKAGTLKVIKTPTGTPSPAVQPIIPTATQTAGQYTFTMPDYAVTVTAEFEEIHIHNPVKVNGRAATETTAGWKNYYQCECGEYFEDSKGTISIDDLSEWKAEGGRGYIAPKADTTTEALTFLQKLHHWFVEFHLTIYAFIRVVINDIFHI